MANNNKVGGIQEFYNTVLWNSSSNYFTPRNKFKISWTAISASDINSIFEKAVQVFNLYIDHIDVPDIVINGGTVINDGRGSYYTNSDEVLTPGSNEIIFYYRDTKISAADMFLRWISYNSLPFIRSEKLNVYIDYISDHDGKTSIMDYKLFGVRPIAVDSIKADHDSKMINLRSITFGFDYIVPNWKTVYNNFDYADAMATQAQNIKKPLTATEYLGKSWDATIGRLKTPATLSNEEKPPVK